ncbi:hypothetical protein [Sphingosinicella sp. BN140058]|uniref:hypothetical protein n=1 Tax=Sphingosinicella sp. BN140058 TaxID=1892855 RepID=UPI001012A12B|nr:hypothetical protein [Sphingosinicella sp. BN140058]QAY80303.1 hypothetical protein ETR14_27045 [Sphingosinicella sp. BN140058]
MAYLFDIRDRHGRKANLTVRKLAEVHSEWARFEAARDAFNPCIEGRCTRSRFDALRSAGERLIAAQERLGVWLIHPANAVPGLRPDDPRIIEDIDALIAA